MTRAAFFTTCIECGSSHPSHSGVCDHCAPMYADDPCDCRDIDSDLADKIPCEKEAGDARSISVAEEWTVYMDEAVSKAPEPLRQLGEYLAGLLDEDQWKTAERYLNAAALSPLPHKEEATPAPVGEQGAWPENLAEIIEAELNGWKGANGGIYAIHAAALGVSIKLRTLATTKRGRG